MITAVGTAVAREMRRPRAIFGPAVSVEEANIVVGVEILVSEGANLVRDGSAEVGTVEVEYFQLLTLPQC